MDLYDDFEIEKMFEDISTVNKTKKSQLHSIAKIELILKKIQKELKI
ncbi:hypothetical protein [Methanobrevibacter arboriphilus]|nr:hypothetical protein [Methanobrevibacter arboriphilus]